MGSPVSYQSSDLYLGVDIDNLLTFKQCFAYTFKKISYKWSLLRRIRYMITVKAALDIIKMFCSIIDYGNIFLSSCNVNDLKDIQTLQNMPYPVVIKYRIQEMNILYICIIFLICC